MDMDSQGNTSTTTDEVPLEAWDVVVVAVYFAVIIGIGIFAMCRANRGTVSGYFLAGRSMTWLPVGASLFVSNIGSEHYIGLAGSGAASGISSGAFEINAMFLIQTLTWIFIPVYMACGVMTMPEYLSKRYGGNRLRVYFAVLSMVLYIFTKCSVGLYTGALFIQQSLKWDLYLCIVALILITAILTLTGGLTAVMYTDTLQAFLMVGGGLVLMGISIHKIGGIDEIYRRFPAAEPTITVPNTTCHRVDNDAFRMLRSWNDSYMPWLGFITGQSIAAVWYWCADQVIVQRVLAAKSVSHAKGASLFAGIIKVLPFFMLVFPGMISRIYFPDEVGCVDRETCYKVCQSYAGCSSIAYPKLVLSFMPTGAKGLMMAVMIAALMSDLDSIFNSASTLFTMDIWKRFRQQASVREMMIVGRVFVVVMTVLAVAWVPVVKETQGGQIFIYVQEIMNYLAPPFSMIFLLGVFVPRVNEMGAFWGLMAALVAGVIRLILIFTYPAPDGCGTVDTRPVVLKEVHYMYFSVIVFILTGLVAVIVSLCSEKPHEHLTYRTTFWTRHLPYKPEPENRVSTGKIFPETSESGSVETQVEYDNPAYAEDGYSRTPPSGTTMSIADNVQSKRDSPNEQSDSDPVSRRVLYFICGFRPVAENKEAEKKMQDHIKKIGELKQDPRARIILIVATLFIVLIGVVLLIFWSVWSPRYAEDICGKDLNDCRTTH